MSNTTTTSTRPQAGDVLVARRLNDTRAVGIYTGDSDDVLHLRDVLVFDRWDVVVERFPYYGVDGVTVAEDDDLVAHYLDIVIEEAEGVEDDAARKHSEASDRVARLQAIRDQRDAQS